MASSLGVELLTSILNHPKGNAAAAREDHLQCDRSTLGILPQQIRGDLNTFETKCLYGEAYDKCTGCSQKIQTAYLSDRAQFMIQVCNDSDYLEELSGLAEMNRQINYDDVQSFGSSGDDIDMD